MVEQIRSAYLCFEAQLAVNQWVISSSLISGAITLLDAKRDIFIEQPRCSFILIQSKPVTICLGQEQ
jgi:hypothetical protein